MPDSSEFTRPPRGLLGLLTNPNQGETLEVVRAVLLKSWHNGNYSHLVAELKLVFPDCILGVRYDSLGLVRTHFNKTTTIELINHIVEKFGNKSGLTSQQLFFLDFAQQVLVRHEKAEKGKTALPAGPNLQSDQPEKSSSPTRVPKSIPVRTSESAQTRPSDEQITTIAMEKFLENPNDNNYLRLSRLISVYALTHSHQAQGNSIYDKERSQSVRTVSGGRCSPR
jgi:hypothetical protein